MILAPIPKIHIEESARRAQRLVWVLCGGILAFFTAQLITVSWDTQTITDSKNAVLVGEGTHYEEMGKGALALYPSKRSYLVPDLSKEILLLAKNSRPDCKGVNPSLLLGVKGSKVSKEVVSGQQLYLASDANETKEKVSYRFSDEKTPLWVRPVVLDKNEVYLEVGYFVPSKESELFSEEKAEILLQVEDYASIKDKQEKPFLSSFKQAKWWGSDVLMKEYGGIEFKQEKEKQKIELIGEEGSQFCYVSAGDYLELKEEKWQLTTLEKVSQYVPMAYVKSILPRQMQIEVWDEKGFYPTTIQLELQMPSKASSKPDAMPASVRLRSSSQISCTLGKRRYVLREGDWILKTAKGWKPLRKSKDIEDCIRHKIRGDLFIFDGIEKKQGKLSAVGHYFDEMRTHMIPVSVPIAGETAGAGTRKDKSSPLLKKGSGRRGMQKDIKSSQGDDNG